MVLVNGQWQGGAKLETYYGARDILQKYLTGCRYYQTSISMDEQLSLDSGIVGGTIIRKQIKDTIKLIEGKSPEKLFTVGGGCDADIASLYYMNTKYNGDLTVLWFDAHGDINSPKESDSHLFFGMPVRMLLGNAYLSDIIKKPLADEQVINIGGRDLDTAEIQYMNAHDIPIVDADGIMGVLPLVSLRKSHNLYIHLDLDCLEPADFSSTPLPVPNGIRFEQLIHLLGVIRENYNVVGMGLYEYIPCTDNTLTMKKLIDYGMKL